MHYNRAEEKGQRERAQRSQRERERENECCAGTRELENWGKK